TVMDEYFSHMKSGLICSLRHDKQVRSGCFDQDFTLEMFVDFIFQNLMSLIGKNCQSCDVLLKVIAKIIY
ncbi:MAG: hypothetical protein RR827_07285, partial [Oscillospiraceae bacterium]